MPYQRSLQKFALPEFFKEAPPEWHRRLREVSPVVPGLDHLVFRYFDSVNPDGSDRGWMHPERGQWSLYTAKPIRLVDPERAEQFRLHWSELPEASPIQPEVRVGRQSVVSDYQHFMWHSQGLYVKPFLILQGEWGGTPATYTPQEKAFLQASHCLDEPLPIGALPMCPFDERVVKHIALRDRFLKVGNDYRALEALDTPSALRAQDDAAERLRRETLLDTLRVMHEPVVEFMKVYMQKKAAVMEFPDAPAELPDTLSQFREHFVEHGHWIGGSPAPSRRSTALVS